jgi:hypothetical protein
MLKTSLFATVFILALGLGVFAQVPFGDGDDAYRFGYEEGYRHGSADSDMGLEFDYNHPHRFQSGITINSYDDSRFRSGYMEGYRDGYDLDDVDDYDVDDVDDDDRLQLMGTTSGFATVFTNRKFEGTSRAFSIGQYPRLTGSLDERIHSVEIHGPIRVILFTEPNFQGQRLILERDAFDLDEFNFGDRAESMIIERTY